jgi:hypothetical protein
MPLTEEEKQRRREALARGREKAAANRAALKAAPKPEPVAMPPIAHETPPPMPPRSVFETPFWREDAGGHMESVPADFVSVLKPDEPRDDFERFLAAQDADIRALLSDLELRVIYDAEQKRAAEEKKTAAKKLAVQRAQRHARSTAGLIGPAALAAADLRERMNLPVSWVINMPEAGNSGTVIDEGVRINGKLYVHGTTVEGTLAEYISYREIEYRAHENERQFQGRSRMSRLAQSGMRFLNNVGHA